MTPRKRSATKLNQPPASKRRRSSRPGRPYQTPIPATDPDNTNIPHLTNTDYTVGWICALEVELAASRAMLDKKHAAFPQDEKDPNTYSLGQLGQHNVVLACLGSGTTGTNSAAIAAANMLRSFPNIRFSLMVGIGGGVPSEPNDDPRKDIRLGDVVVCNPGTKYGGVVQYDFGKTIESGEFIHTSSLNKPPTILLTGVSMLRAQHLENGSAIPQYISRMLASRPIMKQDFQYQGPEHDRLFEADYDHKDSSGSCRNCDETRILYREPRATNDPVIHYGLIASANQVMRHGATRERLRQEHGMLCFEMEAAGLMDNFPCLVVRGICDYSDSHKNKRWQEYAAAVAAAYAKELLETISVAQVTSTKEAVEVMQFSQQHSEILDWLTKADYGATHADTLKKRQLGTGKWFLQHQLFAAWRNGDIRTLFCPGIPGAGKTIIASVVIECIWPAQHDRESGVAFLYCSYGRKNEQTTEELLAILLRQLAEHHPSIPNSVKLLHASHMREKTRPSLQNLYDTLCDVAKSYKRLFLVVDALDECLDGTRRAVLLQLRNLQKTTGLLLMVTSRYLDTLEQEFKGDAQIEIRADAGDVNSYLDGQRATLSECLRADSALWQTVKDRIAGTVDGMFLLATLHLNALKGKRTRGDIKDTLEILPTGYNALQEAYDSAVQRIERQSEDDRNWAQSILSWLVHACRPLKPKELQEALAIRMEHRQLQKEYMPRLGEVTSLCAGLVVYNEENSLVQLAHYTTREYFSDTQRQPDWIRNAPVVISKTCLVYLGFTTFAGGYASHDREFEERLAQNAFLDYAARYWGNHARGQPECDIGNMILEFLMQPTNVSCCVQVTHTSKYRYKGYTQKFPKNVTGLQVAASFGLKGTTGMLLAANADVNAADSTGRTALQVAASGGHLEIVEKLLAANADANAAAAAAKYGRTALQAAAEGGHLETVERLLAANADVNAADAYGRTALQVAASGGHLETVEKLLAANADVNAAAAAAYGGRTALQAAARGGHLETVEKLLAANADVNAAAAVYGGRTVLQAAAEGGHLETVEKLLAANADVNAAAAADGGRTALQAAAEGGHLETVERLLAANADVNAAATAYYGGRTALQAAARGGHLETVERLLAANADVNAAAAAYGGRTALQAAARGGHLETVERLLAANADVNAAAAYGGRTALQAAASGGHLETVERLLAANADVNAAAAAYGGRTALQAAASGGHLETVERLLAANADVNAAAAAAADGGRTALQAAAEGGHLETVERLLAANADVNAAATAYYGGRTALQAAAEGGHLETVEKLLAANADVNAAATADGGRTALQAAAEGGHLETVEKLLAANADVNAAAAAYGGRTALQAAASGGHLETVERLLAANADVNAAATADSGRTALQAAAEGGHLETVEKLLAANADVNAAATADSGRTALQAAAEGGHLETVEKLLAANADVNAAATADSGRTALQAAAEGGHLETVEKLLAANADVNAAATADSGRTALQAAAEGGHLETVERLLAANADVNAAAAAGGGRTALQAAAEGGHLEIVERLKLAINNSNDANHPTHHLTYHLNT
ncbi:MAG: hypothetical protein M1840_006284 [Geoglossum simile]|nr:MAG: hypothetical protein M1840_006284 [Geoglossum simile]